MSASRATVPALEAATSVSREDSLGATVIWRENAKFFFSSLRLQRSMLQQRLLLRIRDIPTSNILTIPSIQHMRLPTTRDNTGEFLRRAPNLAVSLGSMGCPPETSTQ